MTEEGQYARLHAELGQRIRALRNSRSLSAAELGRSVGVSQSTISRFETGRMLPSVAVVRQMLAILDVPGAERQEIEDLARTLATEFNSWRVVLRKSFADHQAEYAAREKAASHVIVYETAILPGLLQLPDYTRAVLERVAVSVPDIPGAVASRTQRQAVLYDTSRRFDFFLTEAALRTAIAPSEVMRAQWDRLLVAASMANVSIRVVPMAAQREVIAFNSFTMFDQALVVVETQTAETVVRDKEDIDVYRKVVAELDRVALTAEATSHAIRGLIASERELIVEERVDTTSVRE